MILSAANIFAEQHCNCKSCRIIRLAESNKHTIFHRRRHSLCWLCVDAASVQYLSCQPKAIVVYPWCYGSLGHAFGPGWCSSQCRGTLCTSVFAGVCGTYPASNLTWKILSHANENNYGVGAYNWYVGFKSTSYSMRFTNDSTTTATTTTELWP